MEKIDIHNSKKKIENALKNLKRDISARNYNLISDFIEASSIGKTARKNARVKQVGPRARLKNLFCLKVIAQAISKPLDNLQVKDVEDFIRGLNENKIIKKDGSAYSEQTKSNIKINLIVFLRYVVKDKVKFSELTDWIETRFKKKEIQALSDEDVKKMLDKCVNINQKAIISVLFDSGSRAEEFLNIRIGDITEVKGDISYYKVLLRNEFSKTAGRDVNLLWKPTTEILRGYLSQLPNKDKLDSPLFPTTYGYLRKLLDKIGKKALRKHVNPHLMRHTSATYYAGQGFDYFQLCKRFGWSIGSNTPNTYINKSGINDKVQIENYIKTNVTDLNEKLEQVEKNKLLEKEKLDSQIEKLNEENKDLKSRINEIERLLGESIILKHQLLANKK